ncbi:MAG: 50S ribosomal protein L19e [Nanoarchaeota archaeon]
MINLTQRKALAAKVLGCGKNKVRFDVAHLAEIKEAITKQDIRDMYAEGIISIAPNGGRMTKEKRRTRRGPGSIKCTIKDGKTEYCILVRKLRRHVKEIRKQGKMNHERHQELRRKIKAGDFKSKAHLKSYMEGKK